MQHNSEFTENTHITSANTNADSDTKAAFHGINVYEQT